MIDGSIFLHDMSHGGAEKETQKKAPKDGWGLEYMEDAICVGLYITDTSSFKEPQIPGMLVADVAASANVSLALL